MPNKEVHSRIKHKRDTHENWTAANPVILSNELIFVDVGSETKIKIGDGVTAYKELPFILEVEHGIEIVEANSEDGVAYVATSKTIKELSTGTMLVAIIKTEATTETPTLNINNLDDVNLRAINVNTGDGVQFRKTSDLSENKAIKLLYNGAEWIAINVPGGVLSVANGGTGATTAALARFMLGLGNTTGAVPITSGGTGAITAKMGLANLGGLPIAGGTMTGELVLTADPTQDLGAATKQYVDNTIKEKIDSYIAGALSAEY